MTPRRLVRVVAVVALLPLFTVIGALRSTQPASADQGNNGDVGGQACQGQSTINGLDCVYDRANSGAVYHSWYNLSTGWKNELAGATRMVGDLRTAPTICADGSSAESIFVVGTDGNVWGTDNSGTGWSSWVNEGNPSASLPYGSLSCDYSNTLSHQDIWVIDSQGQRYEKYGSDDTHWSAWIAPDPGNNGNVGSQACQGQSTINGLDCVYGLASNGAVYHSWYNLSTGWKNELAGATLRVGDLRTAPTICADGSSAESIFVVGTDGNVWGTDNSGTGWSSWVNEGNPSASLPYASLSCDYSNTLSHQDIWVIDSQGQRYEKYGSDDTHWSAWIADPLPVLSPIQGLDDTGIEHGYTWYNLTGEYAKYLNANGQGGCPTSTTCASFSAVTLAEKWSTMEPCPPADDAAACRAIDPNAVFEDGGWFNFSDLQQFISNSTNDGLQLKLRIFAGEYAPTWLMTPQNTYTEYPSDGSSGVGVLRFWTAGSEAAYSTLINAVAAHYNGVYNDVTISGCMTVFAEPLVRGLSGLLPSTVAKNVSSLLAAQYTEAKDQTCQTDAINAHKALTLTNSSFSFNPWDTIDQNGNAVQDETATENLMDTCRTLLGARCVLENNSIRYNTSTWGGDYGKMYNKIQSLGQPIFMQTAGSGNICSANPPQDGECLDGTLSWAHTKFGNIGVEIPNNYNTLCNLGNEGNSYCPVSTDSDGVTGLVYWNKIFNGF